MHPRQTPRIRRQAHGICTLLVALLSALGALITPQAAAVTGETYLTQWATSVIDFSSQWASNSWAATQALGEPNTFTYGDISTAWAARPQNGTVEYIAVGYDTPVYADGAVVRETYGNGAVFQIDALDASGDALTVWSGIDPRYRASPPTSRSCGVALPISCRVSESGSMGTMTWTRGRRSTPSSFWAAPTRPGPGPRPRGCSRTSSQLGLACSR